MTITTDDLYATLERIYALTLPDADLGYITDNHAPLEHLLHDYEGYVRTLGPFEQADRLRLGEQAGTFANHAYQLARRCELDFEWIEDAATRGLIPLYAEYEEGEPPVDPNQYVLFTHAEYAVFKLLRLRTKLCSQAKHPNE